jgi:hypothetical protein
MKKVFITILATLLCVIAYGQENYKLGDFNATQVKSRSVNIGGSWTVKKSSTTAGLEFYYGNTRYAYLTTAGAWYPTTIAGATTIAGTTITGTTITAATTLGIGVQTITQTNTNKATFNNSLKVTDSLFIGANQWLSQIVGNSNRIKTEGSILVSDTLYSSVVYNTGEAFNTGKMYFDSTLYYGDDGSTKDWKIWMEQQTGNPHGRIVFKNIANINIQNKAGTGDVLVLQRDTTNSTAMANLTNIRSVTLTAASFDTATKTAGAIVYLGGVFFGCNGTFWYRFSHTSVANN